MNIPRRIPRLGIDNAEFVIVKMIGLHGPNTP